MYPYTKELTLDEALNTLLNAKCQSYEKDGKVFLTALDYATHILKQAAPPEGYGYAAYELGSGRYDSLPYYLLINERNWMEGMEANYALSNADCKNDWNRYAFRLTDLARVEGISEMETSVTDWEAKYKELEDRLQDAQNCIAVQEREITKLKNYIINQLLNK